MDAQTFNDHFEAFVVQPAREAGFEPWGKGLWMERDGLQVAVLRTELRYHWPFKLTLVARHDCLRDFKDRVPPPRSRNPSEYPVKAPPSESVKLARRYRYQPFNTGRFPSDEMKERRVERQLARIGRALAEAGRILPERLTPAVTLAELEARGEGAWVEARWIEDHRSVLAR